MNTAARLTEEIAKGRLCPGATDLEQWLGAAWIRFPVGGFNLPVLPTFGLKRALVAHDVHHLLLAIPTTLRGEAEIAAWELASGGCGWNVAFWLDRLIVLVLGLLLAPTVTWRGLRRGFGQRNLYGTPIRTSLASDTAELCGRMRVSVP